MGEILSTDRPLKTAQSHPETEHKGAEGAREEQKPEENAMKTGCQEGDSRMYKTGM